MNHPNALKVNVKHAAYLGVLLQALQIAASLYNPAGAVLFERALALILVSLLGIPLFSVVLYGEQNLVENYGFWRLPAISSAFGSLLILILTFIGWAGVFSFEHMVKITCATMFATFFCFAVGLSVE